ncbi:LOW QUALITY PROTEIN: hypothetical protein CRUP_005076, partial [Coryphaenoides rupestris]
MAVGKVTFTRAERDKLAQVLRLLNWISVVTGVIIFSLGLFIKVEIQKRREVMSDQHVLYVPHVLIATGLAACCINFLGGKICSECADGAKFARWKLVMLPYIVCTFCFTFCVLAGALLCYGLPGDLPAGLGLRGAMRYYKDTDTDTPGRCYLKRALDLLQIHFQRCGNAGYRNWFAVQWVSSRYLDMTSPGVLARLRSNVEGKYLTDGIPFSCCNTFSPWPCIQHQLTNNTAHFNYRHQTDRLKTTMENLLLPGDLDSESDGWILEKSLAETAHWNLSIIKNLGKCYQGDDNEDPNIDVPAKHKNQEVPSKTDIPTKMEVPTKTE